MKPPTSNFLSRSVLLALILYMFIGGLHSADPISKLAAAQIGGALLCLIAPFWIADRRGMPVLVRLLLTLGTGSVIVYANAWACVQAGTKNTSIRGHLYLFPFCLPGLSGLCRRKSTFQNKQNNG